VCIDARSKGELLLQLAATDIAVPLATEGRTKEDVERWSVLRLLATLAQYEQLTYPLQARPGDRPDYVVAVPAGTIGIEVTEAVPTNWAWASARREKQNYEEPVMLERFTPGEALRTPEAIEEIAQGRNTGSIWEGNAVEEQFAEVMLHFSLEKKEAFGKTGFKTCDSNWLIIYKRWPLPGLNESLGAKHFSQRLLQLSEPLPFEKVFVECWKTFWEFSHGSVTSLQINDVWNDS
jgi:hypothetical protein